MGNMQLRAMLRENRAYLAKEAAARPVALALVPRNRWPERRPGAPHPVEVFWNRQFLVQIFSERSGLRMTVSRTTVTEEGDWDENISWDDLQQVKREAGCGARWAVEIFPPDEHVVNVANMRHLWLLDEPPAFGWRKQSSKPSDAGDEATRIAARTTKDTPNG